MPTLTVTTKQAAKVWTSPDGQRILYEVMLMDSEGKQLLAKTYSKAIAVEGWNGEVVTEEKTGKFGIETHVKQPQREFTPPSGGGRPSYGGKPQGDNYTMYLSYAKDIVVALVKDNSIETPSEKKAFQSQFDTAIEAAVAGAAELYASRPDAPKEPSEKENLDKVFGQGQIVEGDTPWRSN